jgi:hypothetical protein
MAFPDNLLHFGTPDLTADEDEHRHSKAAHGETVVRLVLPMRKEGFEKQCDRSVFQEALSAAFVDSSRAFLPDAPCPKVSIESTEEAVSEEEPQELSDGPRTQRLHQGQPRITVLAKIIFDRHSYPPSKVWGWGRWTLPIGGGGEPKPKPDELLELFQSLDQNSDGKIAAEVSLSNTYNHICTIADAHTHAHMHASAYPRRSCAP